MRHAVRKLAASALESVSDPVRLRVLVQPLVRDTVLNPQHLDTPRGGRGEHGTVVNDHVMQCKASPRECAERQYARRERAREHMPELGRTTQADRLLNDFADFRHVRGAQQLGCLRGFASLWSSPARSALFMSRRLVE